MAVSREFRASTSPVLCRTMSIRLASSGPCAGAFAAALSDRAGSISTTLCPSALISWTSRDSGSGFTHSSKPSQAMAMLPRVAQGSLTFGGARRPVRDPSCDKLLKANKKMCRKGARVAIGSYKLSGTMSSLSAPNPCNVRARKSVGPVKISFWGAALAPYSQKQFEHNRGSEKTLAIDQNQRQLRHHK